MKKSLVVLSVFCVLLFAFCGGAFGATRLIIGGGPMGGVFYPLAGGIAAIINENVPDVSVSVQVTGGGVENVRLVAVGDVDMGMSGYQQIYYALHNQAPFAGENLSLKTLGALHGTFNQIIVLKSSGLKEFEDLKGKKIAIGEPGGGAELAFNQTIDALGWTEEDVNMLYLPYEQAMEQLGDGLLDAVCVTAGIPTPTVTALTVQTEVEMINQSPAIMEQILAATPLFTFEKVDPKTYRGMSRTITTSAERILLTCSDNMDEELAYKITKAVYENLDKLLTYHAAAASITREAAPNVSGPLNPGAEKYYKEAGLLK